MVDDQAPIVFIKRNNGKARGIGHIHLYWDKNLHKQVGSSVCLNGGGQCPTVGYMRHLGHKFSPAYNTNANPGLPITANPDTVGPVGGFGWVLKLNGGAPRNLLIQETALDPDNMLLLSIAYPIGSTFTIQARQEWCSTNAQYTCTQTYEAMASVDEVRSGAGNGYHVDSDGVLTFRIYQQAKLFNGNPGFFIPTYTTMQRNDNAYALPRFERDGVRLPQSTGGTWIQLDVVCGGTGAYCNETVVDYDPDVCPSGYNQTAYDKCCLIADPSKCVNADGTTV